MKGHRKPKQSKLSFEDKNADYEKFSLYSFNRKSIKFTKPIYVGFNVLDLSEFLMYEWYYDKMQPYFGEYNLELHYLDTDSFIFSFKPIKSLSKIKYILKKISILVVWINLMNYIQEIIKKLFVK